MPSDIAFKVLNALHKTAVKLTGGAPGMEGLPDVLEPTG